MRTGADKAQFADAVSMGYGFVQLEFRAKSSGDAPVAFHRPLAHSVDILIGAALLLPGGDQGAVVKVNVKMIVVAAEEFHFKDHFPNAGKQLLFHAAQACVSAGALAGSLAVKTAAAPYRGGRKLLGVKPFFTGFVAQEVHPQCAVFKKVSELSYQKTVLFCLVFKSHSTVLLP